MRTSNVGWKEWIARQYGGKKGWLRHRVCSLVYFLGGYRRFTQIKWDQVERLVFVCNGNICRSPYGEARARVLGLTSASCGLRAENGKPVYPMTLTMGQQRAVDVSLHRSCAVSEFLSLPGDLFCVMEPWQVKALQQAMNRSDIQITILGLWSCKPRPHIEDPYGLSTEYFATCFSIIDDAIQHIATLLQATYAA